MRKWHLVIDVAKCEDCNNCFLACKDEHVDNSFPGYTLPQPKHGHRWINIDRKERGQFPHIDVAYLPVPCMHCQDAACSRAAERGAVVRREDGIVLIDPERARNQRQIVEACPYGAIYWNEEEQTPQKCTFCAHLLDDGWKEPRCVAVCPTGALRLLRVEDSALQQLIEEEGLELYEPGHGTTPQVFYKNLYRFRKCFVGGSVATEKDGTADCVKGARVVVTRFSDNAAHESVTDEFGDFRIDSLDRESGRHRLTVSHAESGERTLEFELRESLSVGTIIL